MSWYVGVDGVAIDLHPEPEPDDAAPDGPADTRASCALTPDSTIHATASTWHGEVTAYLALGWEQVTIEVCDPHTWARLAAVALEGERLHRAALAALDAQHPAAGRVVELPTGECGGAR